jgi:hypothetical protein
LKPMYYIGLDIGGIGISCGGPLDANRGIILI